MSVEPTRAGGVAAGEPPPGAIVSAALRIFGAHWRTLAVYGLLAGVPVAVLDAVSALGRDVDPFATPLTGAPPGGAGSLASSVLSLVLYAVTSAATVHTVAAAHDGRRVGWQEGLGAGLSRLGGVVAASFIVLVLVIAGLVALVLPGIWIAVALALTTPALVLERLTALAAIRRSYTLVQGRWWRTAAVVALSFLVAFAAVVVVSIPAGVLVATTEDRSLRALIAAVVNALSSGLLIPLTAGVMTVLFLERRGGAAALGAEEGSGRYRGFEPPVAPSGGVRPAATRLGEPAGGDAREPQARPREPSDGAPQSDGPPRTG